MTSQELISEEGRLTTISYPDRRPLLRRELLGKPKRRRGLGGSVVANADHLYRMPTEGVAVRCNRHGAR